MKKRDSTSGKIVLFNRFFFPDLSATSQIASDLAFRLAAEGNEVHAVTSVSSPNLAREETVRGVTIHRVALAPRRGGLARKALDYARYYRGARSAARTLLGEGDIAILKTDPPMLAAAVGPIAKSRGALVVNWLQDVFPEIAMEYGIPGSSFPPLRSLRNRWIRDSAHTVVIGEAMKQRVVATTGIDASRVSVIHNWSRGEEIAPLAPERNDLRVGWVMRDKFVVGYSGNLGRVHEFDTLLAAAKALRQREGIVFLIIGSGPQFDAVRVRAAKEGLSNVRFQPPQARESLAQSLGVADVHLCVLRPEYEGLVVPSKIYGIMAAGRPCIYIGDPKGEPARLFTDNDAGLAVANGDSDGLVRAIESLASDPTRRARMGANSRRLLDEKYDFPLAARQWKDLLETLRLKQKRNV